MPHLDHAYILPLADGMVWTFAAASGGPLAPWLDELAHILSLKKPDSSEASLVVSHPSFRGRIRLIPMDKNRNPAGTAKSWMSFTQGSAYQAWISPEANEAVLEINPEFIDHPEIRYIDMSAVLRIVFHYCVASGSGCSLHAASAALNGRGIVIVASGQTGKSTCHGRLPGTWTPLADDCALAVKIPAGGFAIQPMPTWSNYLRREKASVFDTGAAYPLKALFFLEQDDKDEVEKVLPSIAAGILHRLSREAWGAFINRFPATEKKKLGRSVFEACCAVANATPGYILRATLHGKFWREIEKVL
jgi:SynChlorMet cassette protein ScmC